MIAPIIATTQPPTPAAPSCQAARVARAERANAARRVLVVHLGEDSKMM